MENIVDINETEIFNRYPDILTTLLKDHTTGQNIFWATDSYAHLGNGFQYKDAITIDHIIDNNEKIIRPRAVKSRETQQQRSRKMAEVFTPSWICNKQNNLIDNSWFCRENVFNTEVDNIDESHSWVPSEGKITFPCGKTWHDYIKANRLEITCGEAPYLVSRYDSVTGEFIPIERRIGLLDRKLRVVGENTETSGEWLIAAKFAYTSTYGYEWQGDNLMLARESLLISFIEYYRHKFGKEPQLKSIYTIADVISWNIWQMDGLKCVVPNSCSFKVSAQQTLFEESKILPCEGCKTGDMHKHNGIYCLIKDWSNNEILTFVSLLENK